MLQLTQLTVLTDSQQWIPHMHNYKYCQSVVGHGYNERVESPKQGLGEDR